MNNPLLTAPQNITWTFTHTEPDPACRPETLSELLYIRPEELNLVDIGRMNLLCSSELPETANMDLSESLARLNELGKVIYQNTQNKGEYFEKYRVEFNNSKPTFRLFFLVRILQRCLGYSYSQEERSLKSEADWNKTNRHFLYGLLEPPFEGTCSSLPVLMAAAGRRIGYPIKLVHSPGHVFCRWEGIGHPVSAWQERLNAEVSDDFDSFPDEHYYHSPIEWKPEWYQYERERGEWPLYLRSLTPAEELASFLVQRAHAFEARNEFDQASLTYAIAAQLAPHNDSYTFFRKQCAQKQVEQMWKDWSPSRQSMEQLFNGNHSSLETPDEMLKLGPYSMPKTKPLSEAVGSFFNKAFKGRISLTPGQSGVLSRIRTGSFPEQMSSFKKMIKDLDFSLPSVKN